MIMYTLHKVHGNTATQISAGPALQILEAMAGNGVIRWTTTFPSPDGRIVSAFWATDVHGHVAMVLEHTYVHYDVPVSGITVERMPVGA